MPYLVPGNTGLASPFLVYTIDPKSVGGESIIKRFLGCAFPAAPDGHLVTCTHVATGLKPKTEETLMVQHPLESICHEVKSITSHPKHDFAVMKIEAQLHCVPTRITNELMLGSDVLAYGYYDNTVEGIKLIAVPEVYSGTITATPHVFRMPLPTILPFYQLSFPALVGFSGSPLYAKVPGGVALAGMIFGNMSSQVVERILFESEDEGSKIIEKSVRIWESGVAHTSMALDQFAKEMGFHLWP